jgi:hypothetical protein
VKLPTDERLRDRGGLRYRSVQSIHVSGVWPGLLRGDAGILEEASKHSLRGEVLTCYLVGG